jgi:hypothetical protein
MIGPGSIDHDFIEVEILPKNDLAPYSPDLQ